MLGFYSADIPLAVIATELYRLAEMPILVAIPLFTFAGYMMGEGGAPKRLVRLTDALIDYANFSGTNAFNKYQIGNTSARLITMLKK